MKIYRLKDGGTIAAASDQEFVTKLRESSKFDSELSDQVFMQHFVERLQIYEESIIRTDNPGNFITDLITTGFIL